MGQGKRQKIEDVRLNALRGYQSYSYYITHAKIGDKNLHISCPDIDSQIPQWLKSIAVNQELIPLIRKVYNLKLNKPQRKRIKENGL